MNTKKTNSPTHKICSSISIEELSSTLTYIELLLIGAVMITINVVTIVGNALVLVSFALDKKLRTLSNYFLLSLAVSDVMIAAFSMPLFTAYLLIGEWTLGPALCNMWLAQDYTCSNASCLNLLAIALDRYFSVTDPLRYRAKRTARRVGIMIGSVWAISFLLWPPWIYAWPYIEGRRTVPEDDCYVQFLETNTYVTVVTTSVDYYIPVFVILVLYYRIWRETKRRSRYLSDMEAGYQSESICLQVDKSFQNSNSHDETVSSKVSSEVDAEAALLPESTESGKESICGRNSSKNADLSHESTSTVQNVDSKTLPQSAKRDKAARVLSVILLAFILTTMPYNIIVVIKNLDASQTIVPDVVWNFFYYLFYVNSTLNPLCYALANENFRETYWRILTCSWTRSPRGTYSISSFSKSSESKL